MDSLWSILSKRKNQQVVSWIGAGVVVVAGGIWAVVTYVWPPHLSDQAPSITQSTSGPASPTIANVKGNIVTNGNVGK